MRASLRAGPQRPRRRVHGLRPDARHLLAEALFRDVLHLERRRADRSGKPVVLLCIRVADNANGLSAAEWRRVVDALDDGTGGRAVLGWSDGTAVLGAIVPATPAWAIETRVRRAVERHVSPDVRCRLSIRSYVHSPLSAGGARPRRPDPLFDDGRASAATRAGEWLKRALDVAGCLLLLPLLSPVFLVVAVLLRLTSPGPVLFRQQRLGQSGVPFTMLKFRTLRANADPALHHAYVTALIRSSARLHPASRKVLAKLTDDPRVTPLGRILRKTSLDELPQLWNVLRGDMSLVGPRPPLAYEVEQYELWHCRRLHARPGMTGLWQVSGRGRTTFDDMVRLDVRYARSRSFWTDVKILLATPWAVISGKGAG